MWKSLKQRLLLPRATALRDADVSFRDWLLHAANASRSSVLIRWGVAVAISMIPVALWLIVWAIVEATDFFEYSFTLDEVHEAIFGWYWNDETTLITVAIAIVVIVSPIAFAFLTRRRVLALLNHRARCPRCLHDATNQSINDAGMVTCSECGFAIATREVWNEHSGRATDSPQLLFGPATNLVKYFWTRRRLKVAGIVTASLALVASVGYGGWWGLREWRYRSMAEQASSAVRNLDASNEIITSLFAEDTAQSGPTIWTELESLQQAIDDELRAATERHKPTDPDVAQDYFPDFGDLLESNQPPDERTAKEGFKLSRLAAREAFEALHESGVCARIDHLAKLSTRNPPLMSAQDRVTGLQLSAARRIVRLNAARAASSIEKGDVEATIAAWRSSLAVLQAHSRYPLFLAHLSAAASYGVVCDDIRRASLTNLNNDTAKRVMELLSEFKPEFDYHAVVAVERGIALDSVADFFADISEAQKGLDADYFAMLHTLSDGPIGRLGTFAENVDAINAEFDKLDAQPSLEAGQDPMKKKVSEADLAILHWVVSLDMIHSTCLHANLEINATLTAIAIESYREREGKYPQALAQLVPRDIAQLPVDEWTGKPLCYRYPLESGAQSSHPFMLYSTGPDREDNAGRVEVAQLNPFANVGAGCDIVFTYKKN